MKENLWKSNVNFEFSPICKDQPIETFIYKTHLTRTQIKTPSRALLKLTHNSFFHHWTHHVYFVESKPVGQVWAEEYPWEQKNPRKTGLQMHTQGQISVNLWKVKVTFERFPIIERFLSVPGYASRLM